MIAATSPEQAAGPRSCSVVSKPPADAETLRKNPLGLYVDAIDWSRELETSPPSVPPAATTLTSKRFAARHAGPQLRRRSGL